LWQPSIKTQSGVFSPHMS